MPVPDFITDRCNSLRWLECALTAAQWEAVQANLELSARQLQILQALCEFGNVEEAAESLATTEAAIDAHLAKLCRELELASLDELLGAIRSAILSKSERDLPEVPPFEEQPSVENFVDVPSTDAFMTAKQVVCLLATGYRFDILAELIGGPKDVSSLAAAIGASMSTTSQNLRCLRDLNLVRFERSGLQCCYRLAKNVKAAVEAEGLALTFSANGSRCVTIHITSHEAT